MGSVRTLLTNHRKIDEHLQIPPAFLYHGWNLFLPQGTPSLMLSVMYYIIEGLNQKEIFQAMVNEAELLSLHPFSFLQTPDLSTEKEKAIYKEKFERETRIKQVLERSGYQYPKNVQDSLLLLIKLGIFIQVEIGEEKEIYLDMILEPFPRPEQRLVLHEEDYEVMKQYGNRLISEERGRK